ncbi:thrombospondin type 3 repeat-containing protein [Myxococcota bacterium]|nr:thrombospondin type 3 repeat-containing protein [Myxococcota bacterium]
MNRLCLSTLSFALFFACGGASEDAADAGDPGDPGASGGARPPGETGGGGGDGPAPGTGGAGGDAPLPKIEPFETALADDQETGTLTPEQIAALCAEVGAYEAAFDAELRALRCLDFAVLTTLVGSGDPATCDRLRPLCETAPIGAEGVARSCVSAFENRAGYCTSTSMTDFAACVTENIQREIAGAAVAELTCEAAVARGYVMPEGRRDCACNVPIYAGPAPADDLDRDGVSEADDHCPMTALHEPVSAVGCSVEEDRDQDGVPNDPDVCGDTAPGEAVGATGCSQAQDADQDGVPDALDRCDDTPAGEVIDEAGCGTSGDADADGVPDATDACLGTPAGEVVIRNGCARSQDEDVDGVSNVDDRCPGTETPESANAAGCDRRQDEDDDGVPNDSDRCPFTGIDGDTVVSVHGCSVSQDRDQDGIENFPDVCEDTPPGAEVSAVGCSRGQDEDWDTVLNRVDACPFTPVGSPVDRDGCTVDQRADLGAPLDGPPEGAEMIRLGLERAEPMTMFAMPDVIQDREDGSRAVQGNLMLQMPTGQVINMPRADVRFSDAGAGGFQRIDGTVDVPMPAVRLLDGLRLHAPSTARVRIDRGSAPDLQALGAPLDPERVYLVFNMEAGLSLDLGPLTFSPGASRELLLIVDPLDPGFYVRTNCEGIPYLARLSDIGLGVSLSGRFPFTPADTWGVEDVARPFDGHLTFDASAEIPTGLPSALARLEVAGEAVLDIDADRDGRSVFQEGRLDEGVRLGVNGEILLELMFLGPDQIIGVPLAQASLGLEAGGGRHTGWATGHVGVDELRLPVSIPVVPAAELRAAALLAQDVAGSFVRFAGRLQLQASQLPVPGISLNDVVVDGDLTIDATGIHLVGQLDRSLHDSIRFGPGGVRLDARLDWSGLGFDVVLDGLMSRDGQEIRRLRIGTSGIDVEG